MHVTHTLYCTTYYIYHTCTHRWVSRFRRIIAGQAIPPYEEIRYDEVCFYTIMLLLIGGYVVFAPSLCLSLVLCTQLAY